MPGLVTSMDPNQVSVISSQTTFNNPVHVNEAHIFQHDERDDDDDALDDAGGEEYNETTYRPRPQLPKPFVCMRSLADLIRKFKC
jgi:hypothetical protein